MPDPRIRVIQRWENAVTNAQRLAIAIGAGATFYALRRPQRRFIVGAAGLLIGAWAGRHLLLRVHHPLLVDGPPAATGDEVDLASEASFPASDPPSFTRVPHHRR